MNELMKTNKAKMIVIRNGYGRLVVTDDAYDIGGLLVRAERFNPAQRPRSIPE
jgi:hypothetical protein